MKIIISPAKKMKEDSYSPAEVYLPSFLEETKKLYAILGAMDETSLQKLWKCNDSIAQENWQRLQGMELERNLTPAIFAYEGIQYRYMAPAVMEEEQLAYLQRHLVILSGFYGALRPMDGVTPYRLEMASKLAVGEWKNLYQFWGDKLANYLATDTHCILNLASQEYSRVIQPHLPQHIPFITCTFGERKGEAIIEKGTMCKMARGQMVRWMAEHQVTKPEEIQAFHQLGYQFSPEHSSKTHYTFIKGENTSC